MTHLTRTLLAIAALCAVPAAAQAHITIVTPSGIANATQEITFGVGHGCTGADTVKVRVQIPTGVSSVRPLTSDFGKISVEKDAAGTITAVAWQKADADVLDADLAYYKVVVRLKVPDQPFTTLYFPAQQTCKAADGTLTTVDWKILPTDAPVDGGLDEPAPELRVVPAHVAGWNKLKVAVAVTDLPRYFGDALIVWKGAAAFSANGATADLIKNTQGVTQLSALAANDEIWVKY